MTEDLENRASGFASDLTTTVRALAPGSAPFSVTASPPREGLERVQVKQAPDTGVILTVSDKPLLALKAIYFCTLDREKHHLAVGGPRFRPCLEDILNMLVIEFGVDCTKDGITALREGRMRWRQMQVAAAAQESPESAAAALRILGYRVETPAGGPASDDIESLQDL